MLRNILLFTLFFSCEGKGNLLKGDAQTDLYNGEESTNSEFFLLRKHKRLNTSRLHSGSNEIDLTEPRQFIRNLKKKHLLTSSTQPQKAHEPNARADLFHENAGHTKEVHVPSINESLSQGLQISATPSFSLSSQPSLRPTVKSTSCDELLDTFKCTTSDCEVLRDIYKSTDGCNWDVKTNWLQDVNICNWLGITCTENVVESQGFEVTEINLANNNLHGTLPTSIGSMLFLTQIDFKSNSLGGVIPNELGHLVSLETLVLSDNEYDNRFNDIDGVIPESVCDLIENGQLSTLVTDCAFPFYVDCNCCTTCTNIAPSEKPSIKPSLSVEPSISMIPNMVCNVRC